VNVARLYLWLSVDKRSAWYSVVPLEADPEVAVKAWRVKKIGGDSYDVFVCPRGYMACTCGNAVYKANGHCKHARALKALGLMG
jgi:hypothetical protein